MNLMNNIGKIEKVSFEKRDGRLGIWFVLESDGWSVMSERSVWDYNEAEVSKHTKWSEQDRDDEMASMMEYISNLMHQAKVTDIQSLKGKPITLQIEGNVLQDWRLLTEVL